MAQISEFPAGVVLTRRLHRAKRTFESKYQEIKERSPQDRAAFETLADHVLARLNAKEREHH